jgi:hypothetical protein
MAFDMASARPVNTGKFDMASAVPVSDVSQQPAAPQEPGFFQDLADKQKSGELTATGAAAQGAERLVGEVYKPIMWAGKTAWEGAKNMYPAVGKIAGGLQQLAESPMVQNDPITKLAKYDIQRGGELYSEAEKKYPALRTARATVNTALGVAPAIGFAENVAARGIKAVAPVIKDPLTAMDKALTPKQKPIFETSAETKAAASQKYNFAKTAVIHQNEAADLYRNIDSIIPKGIQTKKYWESSPAGKQAEMLKTSLTEGTLTFDDMIATRKQINADIADNISTPLKAGNPEHVKQLEELKSVLHRTMTSPPSDLADAAKRNAWQAANHEWGIGATKEEVQNGVRKVINQEQPANAVKRELYKYLLKNEKTLLPNEIAILEDIINTTGKERFLKDTASGLLKYAGFAKGGIPGYLIGRVGSNFAKDQALASVLRKVEKFFAEVDARPAPKGYGPWEIPAPEKPPAPPLQLTNQRRSTAEQRYERSQRTNERGASSTIYGPNLQTGVDLHGVPYETGVIPEPKLLPSPENMRPMESLVTRAGEVRPQSSSEFSQAKTARQREIDMGLAGTRKNLSRLEIREKLGPVFDALDEKSKLKVESDFKRAWMGNKPLNDIVKDFHSRHKTQISEAMINALRKKPSIHEINTAKFNAKKGK